MSEPNATDPRLILFCSGGDVDVAVVRKAVELEAVELEAVTVSAPRGPESVMAAGWAALEISTAGGSRTRLGDRLEALTEAVFQALDREVLCVFSEPARGRSRACLRSKSAAPRLADGDGFQVLRQVAEWLEVEPVPLLRFFVPSEAPAVGGDAQLGSVQLSGEKDLEAEMDEDDRFVESKLKRARELMEQYRRAKR